MRPLRGLVQSIHGGVVVWCELALQETWFSIGVGVFERVYCDEVGLVGKRGGDRLLRSVWFHVFLRW